MGLHVWQTMGYEEIRNSYRNGNKIIENTGSENLDCFFIQSVGTTVIH